MQAIFGTTRSAVRPDHALIAPDSHVEAPLAGWTDTRGIVLISPRMGARFTQYLALMDPGAEAAPATRSVERFAFVEEGRVLLRQKAEKGGGRSELSPGCYVWLPPAAEATLAAAEASRLIVFERRYEPLDGVAPPALLTGRREDVPGEPFLGDPAARLQTLLPDEPAFDMAVNLFRYEVGASLPFVEVHVMEHGLTMLSGRGIYRLGDAWYPVAAGDTLWMAPFCPQWFAAIGTEPASYLYYKDVHRPPLGEPPNGL